MTFIQEFFTSRNNKANNTTYVGQRDRLWYDSATNTIRISDGSTPGGLVVSGGGSSSTYGNANVAAYLPGDPTILAVNAAIVTANVGMKSYVDSQVISAGGYNDAAVAAFMPSYTGSLSNSSDIIALYANAALQHMQLLAANSAIVTANIGLKAYTDTQISTANSAVVSYVNTLNSAMIANVNAANAAVITANTNMKAYVDAKIISGGYGNTEVAAFLPTYSGSLSNSSDIINIRAVKANIDSPTFSGNVVFSSVTAIQLPAGNINQRPPGVAGQIRFNTEQNTFEGFTTGWGAIAGSGGSTGFPVVDLGSITETAAIFVDLGSIA
jgi:hypothetical protein